MSWIPVVALTAAPLVALILAVWRRLRALTRALAAERARARLMEAGHHRDMTALRNRLTAARAAAPVLEAADLELTRALALYAPTDPTEGRPR